MMNSVNDWLFARAALSSTWRLEPVTRILMRESLASRTLLSFLIFPFVYVQCEYKYSIHPLGRRAPPTEPSQPKGQKVYPSTCWAFSVGSYFMDSLSLAYLHHITESSRIYNLDSDAIRDSYFTRFKWVIDHENIWCALRNSPNREGKLHSHTM